MPTLTTSKPVTIHEVKVSNINYFDYLTILLPVIIPIITFRLGYTYNRREEKRKETERFKEVKIYFLTLAKFLAEILDEQAKVIQDATAMVELMTDNNISAGIYPELNTKRIKAIPDLDLYKIFIAGTKNSVDYNTRMLNKLSSALDSIDSIKIQLEQNNAELIKEILLYIEIYNNIYNLIANENAQIIKQGSLRTILNDTEYFELNRILTVCSKEMSDKVKDENIPVTDITKRYNFFIKPLYERTRHINETKSTLDMLNNIHELNFNYQNFILVKNMAISKLSDLETNCKNVSKEVKAIYDNLTA